MRSLAVVSLVTMAACWGGIETGNVGVRKSFFGEVQMEEEGVGFYTAVFDSVREYSTKEVPVELENLTPKAKDNLSLQSMDITVYYKVARDKVADLVIKYANQHRRGEGAHLPCYVLVENISRGVTYEEVAKVDSLKMHTRRDEMAVAIKEKLQERLDRDDEGVFTVTRVVIRSVLTDPSIEAAIRRAIAKQKELEAMETKVEIAAKEAEVRIAESKGIAEANKIINRSLTREYLQHEANQVLLEFAKSGKNNTVVIPANMQSAPLINVN